MRAREMEGEGCRRKRGEGLRKRRKEERRSRRKKGREEKRARTWCGEEEEILFSCQRKIGRSTTHHHPLLTRRQQRLAFILQVATPACNLT